MCIQLLWLTLTHLYLSFQQLQWNDLSTANNHTFTETEWQKWFCDHDPSSELDPSVFNFRWPQRRGENETQRHVRAEVTSLWYYVIQWIKGQLHPKDQNHIFTKSPWAVLVILWELQRMRALGFKYIWTIKHWKDCFKWPAQLHLRFILCH